MDRRVTKEEAAAWLLDSAIAAWLDRADALSAIVLGGAAEDVYQGLLQRANRHEEAARAQDLARIREVLRDIDPSVSLDSGAGHELMRRYYNWLRHNDRADEPQEIRIDFDSEALTVLERALENASLWTGTEHPRLSEVLTKNLRR